jgi:hypothetical protein
MSPLKPLELRRAADALTRVYGPTPLGKLLTQVADAWDLTMNGPISTIEKFRWSGVCQSAYELARETNAAMAARLETSPKVGDEVDREDQQ